MRVISENAWAKLNLALHVTGKRGDGYHLLDSLVVFAVTSDEICVSPDPNTASELSLTIEGPMAEHLPADIAGNSDNLVLQAASALSNFAAARGQAVSGAQIILKKRLPVAAGIGGGSADAAATLRALNKLWDLNLDHMDLEELGATLGADVPVCVGEKPARIRGIGTQVEPVPRMPMFYLVLVNPNIAVSTPAIFKALSNANNAPMIDLPTSTDMDDWLSWLNANRNDLLAPAVKLCPAIADVLAALEDAGAKLARMSGSGATCFGIFDDFDQAQTAAIAISKAHPQWWVDAAETI